MASPPSPSLIQNNSDLDEEESGYIAGFFSRRKTSSKGAAAEVMPAAEQAVSNDLSLGSPAWMCMQCDLGLVLPALPPPDASLASEEGGDTEQYRRDALRQCLPSEYLLLPDLVVPTSTEWKLRNRRIVVLVVAIQSLTDNLWTVKVTDETSAVVTAWIQPRLVREEQQRQQPKFVRPGLVWLLVNPTLILVNNAGDGGNNRSGADRDSLERMLLISEETIDRVWTPAQAKEISDERFVAWMEQRNVLSASIMDRWDGAPGTTLSQRQAQRHPALTPPKEMAQLQQPYIDARLPVATEDRAPAGNSHESDDEELSWESSQAMEPRRPSQRSERTKEAHHQVTVHRGKRNFSPLPPVRTLQNSEYVVRTSQCAPLPPPILQTVPVTSRVMETQSLPTNSSGCEAGTTVDLIQCHVGQSRDRIGSGVCDGSESSLSIVSRTLSPAPKPASLSTVPTPARLSAPSVSAGKALGGGYSLGFSRCLSTQPIPASDPAQRPPEPSTAVYRQTSKTQLDGSQLIPLSLLPSPDRRSSLGATQSSRSKKRRRRGKRRPVVDVDHPRIDSTTSSSKPSGLWDAANTYTLSILDAFDDDDEDDEKDHGADMDAQVPKTGPMQGDNADPAVPDIDQGSDDEDSYIMGTRPPGRSLFQASLCNTEGLDDLFTDGEEEDQPLK
jgi:hypothetical protein